MSFYELNENNEFLDSQINAFNMFLKRNKILNEKGKESSLNFIKAFKMLCKDKPKIAKLEQLIHSPAPMICRNWLIEKVENLK